MNQKETITEKDLLVDLTLHNISAEMLKEFALRIFKPYFVATLTKPTVEEETMVSKAMIMECQFLSSG